MRSVKPAVLLGLAHYGVELEAVLPDSATDRTGEDASLKRRDADPAVELGAPGLLVGLDQQPQLG